MFNTDFLKTLNILYVEDDDEIRGSLSPIFNKLFNEVFIGVDGENGLDKFKEMNSKIDIIISDISMPNLNGIEMLGEIRKISKTVPLIFTTAHAEANYLMDAIKLGVSHYAVKPINTKDVILQIQQVCEVKYQEKLLKVKQKELEEYLSVLDKVAIVSKTDLTGKIIFVNDMFCEISGYERDELMGKPHNIVRHPDSSHSIFKSIWETIQNKDIWHGKLKNITKDGDPYYIDATIMPIVGYNGEINEYIGIRFLTTDHENEKREFKKKVIQNIQKQKEKESDYLDKINNLESNLKQFDNLNLLGDKVETEKKRNEKLMKQIKHFEDYIVQLNSKSSKLVKAANIKMSQMSDKLDKTVRENKRITLLVDKLELDMKINATLIESQTVDLQERAKKIENLHQVIAHREQQLRGKK